MMASQFTMIAWSISNEVCLSLPGFLEFLIIQLLIKCYSNEMKIHMNVFKYYKNPWSIVSIV